MKCVGLPSGGDSNVCRHFAHYMRGLVLLQDLGTSSNIPWVCFIVTATSQYPGSHIQNFKLNFSPKSRWASLVQHLNVVRTDWELVCYLSTW